MEGALWYEAREAVAGVAEVAARYDDDGVDIVFLNSRKTGEGLTVSRSLLQKIQM